ncbi:uncharacterized protein LOC143152144 isoform X2 [Ptiloglossa arizonensis]|uniref:uncharacterized protein LOC143152144 isoform X2 n=1 Tax=Ptiloglossa arizonensis TaxID=3350558 RepID=UPI003FA1898F
MSVSEEYAKEEMPVSKSKRSLEDSLSMLSEELDALDIKPVMLNSSNGFISSETLVDIFLELVDAAWELIHKHRSHMKKYDQLDDIRCKISNNNYNLTNHVKALKKALERQECTLNQALERERRAKEEIQRLTREHKCLKEEMIKLGKLLRSKEDQHEHKLRCIVQSRDKYREQLAKLMEFREMKSERKEIDRRGIDGKRGGNETTIRSASNLVRRVRRG